MDLGTILDVSLNILQIFAALFVFLIGLILLGLVVLFILDISQTKHAIRRNYPIIGRLRVVFEQLGTFFRQYFFAMDREEMPFNRELRNWVYRAAQNLDNTIAFGSTRNLQTPGTVLFVNSAFAMLQEDILPPRTVTIGSACRTPY